MQHVDLWGPVDLGHWRAVPHVAGRPAERSDVQEGRAVFDVGGTPAQASDMALPVCAIFHDSDLGQSSLVVIIQAELVDNEVTLGFRFLTGGNGVATLPEVELLDGPTDELPS